MAAIKNPAEAAGDVADFADTAISMHATGMDPETRCGLYCELAKAYALTAIARALDRIADRMPDAP